jgi:hypothetical protein
MARLETEAYKKGTNHIRISCQDEHIPSTPAANRVVCADLISERSVGGYALASSKTYKDNTIVLCPTFFLMSDLNDVDLHFAAGLDPDRGGWAGSEPWDGKDPGKMKNRAMTLLHELSHLAVIADQYPSKYVA